VKKISLFILLTLLKTLLSLPAAGWTTGALFKGATDRDRLSRQAALHTQLKAFLEKVAKSPCAWPFEKAVSADEVRVARCTSMLD